jgi:hypothetical protein
MKMISHQALGQNEPVGFGARLAKSFQKTMPVGVTVENRLAPVAPVHDMVERSGVSDAQLPGHGLTLTPLELCVNSKD